MPLRKKIILGILVVLLICIGAAGFFLFDDISLLATGLRYSTEELEQKLEQNDQAIKDAAQIVPEVTIRELTEADKQALKDGTVTKEDLIQSMIEPVQTPEPPASDVPQTPTQKEESQAPLPQVTDYHKQLASILAEVYVLREEFLIKLDNLMAEAKAEYLSVPSKERTSTKLASMASKYYTRAHNLELECDARMKEIIARMEALLKENGGDLSVAQAVMDTYLNEKSLKKSWYLAELKKRGI